ncbi:MAG: AAA domain-containing protein [Treponema sp.]|nr:AAA domain-containing protein [Treponema sp.]
MTSEDKKLFDKLSSDRKDSAKTLEKRSMKGVKTSVIEKYSDQAHFVYELLQNADDTGATEVHFDLLDDKLIFIHNGTRHFSVTDVEKETEDSDNGRLGDLNSITSIANSAKGNESTIGKFGVGFKAVFQYTETPYIYDSNYRFKIERFIVPVELHDDYPGRKSNETVFVFPFNHGKRTAEEAFTDIENKLRSLVLPVLFLNKLQRITFSIENSSGGEYSKEIIKKIDFNNLTIGKFLKLKQNNGTEDTDELIWTFSRDWDADQLEYTVGFFIGRDKAKSEKAKKDIYNLAARVYPAFCYFPTKVSTGLNFLIHAPFLLTDSREGIKAGDEHNHKMIDKLAVLAGDSILYLRDISKTFEKNFIDDNILNILPYQQLTGDNKQSIDFNPFFNSVYNIFRTEKIIPGINNTFSKAKDSYLPENTDVEKLFTENMLKTLTENKDAKWGFVEVKSGNDKYGFIEEILDSAKYDFYEYPTILQKRSRVIFSDLLGAITNDFIENQTFEWLNRFYRYICETNQRCESARKYAIFLDESKKAVAAFDTDNHQCLFLPSTNVTGYITINKDLLQQKYTKQLLDEYKITEPSLKGEIYNKLIPQYGDKKIKPDTIEHFKKFLSFYVECSISDRSELIEKLKRIEFVRYTVVTDKIVYRGKPELIYYPDEELKTYFSSKVDTRFLDLEGYKLVAGESGKFLDAFFSELGVSHFPRIEKKNLSTYEFVSIGEYKNIKLEHYSSYSHLFERYVDGCSEILDTICSKKDINLSVVLWNILINILQCCNIDFYNKLQGEFNYVYYYERVQIFDSRNITWLRHRAWVLNSENNLVSPDSITFDDLSINYNTSGKYTAELIKFLEIREPINTETINELSGKEKYKYELGSIANELGITEEDLRELARQKKNKNDNRDITEINNVNENKMSIHPESKSINNDEYNYYPKAEESNSTDKKTFNEDIIAQEKNDFLVMSDIRNRLKVKREQIKTQKGEKDKKFTALNTENLQSERENLKVEKENIDYDEDEYTKPPVDYNKKLERAKNKSADDLYDLENMSKWQEIATSSKKYSYIWFTALLELEIYENNQSNYNSKEISITFTKVEQEEGSERTLILREPSRNIPQFMEELENVPLLLTFSDKTKRLEIEVINVMSYVLRARLKPNENIKDLKFEDVREAHIEAKNPVFLLNELKKSFSELKFDNKFDMQTNLCENIEFIFGPPGTGKTTYLAKNVIIPFIKNNEKVKVLVLTPTNKAGDVVINKIQHQSIDGSYKDWLVRFGTTSDENIEESGIFKDKSFNIKSQNKSVVVTTIARFAYDFFIPDSSTRVYIKEINWDYIIIDEASMISLINIVYLLYKKTPRKFIIAGDPFQIEPITAVDMWKNENIYTMVKLDSFEAPQTIPHKYPVHLLMTQYRSIPEIGEVFSKLTYGGMLQHDRSSEGRIKINLGDKLILKPINIIDFPISEYESIYKSKKLNNSPYHIYTALLTFEYIKYFSKQISINDSNNKISIGVIAPYRAESDLIEKLCSRFVFANNITVQCGTIHGFQGDECNVIIAVFNPPPNISTSKEMFLNKKNIINVAISRARDYLIILMPDSESGLGKMHVISKLRDLCRKTDYQEIKSEQVESIIFNGNTKFIEGNSFATSHQNVNVYDTPDSRYEIRTGDSAVDVQIHIKTKIVIKKRHPKFHVE